MATLDIQNIVVNYGKVTALKGVSMTVEAGELVAVIGSNGAGKTTTMNTISGLLRPTSGDIFFENKSISKLVAHKITALGIAHVPEGRKVFSTLSVKDNLQLGAYLRLRRGEKRAVADDIERIYASFPRLRERETQLAGTLSGGEQQMLALGRALVSKPKLLLLDEPSMGLAPVIIDEVFRLITELKKSGDMTIFLVEQLAFRALEVADRAYVLEQGTTKITGKGSDLMKNEAVRTAYLGVAAGKVKSESNDSPFHESSSGKGSS
jgi:branched-chain amino acid transport system ATP-binding protein